MPQIDLLYDRLQPLEDSAYDQQALTLICSRFVPYLCTVLVAAGSSRVNIHAVSAGFVSPQLPSFHLD